MDFGKKSSVVRMIGFDDCREESHSRPTGDFSGFSHCEPETNPPLRASYFQNKVLAGVVFLHIHTTDVRQVEWSAVMKGEVSLLMH